MTQPESTPPQLRLLTPVSAEAVGACDVETGVCLPGPTDPAATDHSTTESQPGESVSTPKKHER